jgi:hypothetical protein
VAGREGAASGYSSSSPSSGGLDLGFDASLLRYRRACFDATADLDSLARYIKEHGEGSCRSLPKNVGTEQRILLAKLRFFGSPFSV